MPLTARLDDIVLDASSSQLGQPADAIGWSDIYKQRPRRDLRCRECGAPMSAKVSSLGTRFFAHIRRPETCTLARESAIHLELKAVIATVARQHGWLANVEAAGDGWRADVLTIHPEDGSRFAWEVQHSPIDSDEVDDRTARHMADGVTTVWVTTRHWPWCEQAGALVLAARETTTAPWTVPDSVCNWEPVLDIAGPMIRWIPTHVEFGATVGFILTGELVKEDVPVEDDWGWQQQRRRWIPRAQADRWIKDQPDLPEALPARLCLRWQNCYRCGRETAAIVGICPFDPTTGREYPQIDAEHEGVLARIEAAMAGKIVPSPELPIGAIKKRYSRTVRGEYLSNGCYWCDAILGNWYLYGPGSTADTSEDMDDDEDLDDDLVDDPEEYVIGPIPLARLRKMQRQSRSI